MKPGRKKQILVGVPVLAAVALGVWYARSGRAVAPETLIGMVRTTEIHIAPEISGHLARVLVTPSQRVGRGDPVALLTSPELWAAVGQARAQVDKAKSDRDRVYAGVRQEEVSALQREILKAQAAQTLAGQELARKSVLAAKSDASIAQLNEAQAEAARTDADVAVARARYAEAQLGPTAEERALADAQVTAAEADRDVVEARAAKMLLRAPTAGTVGIIVPEIGEAVVPGEPILTLIPDRGIWFGFNLREDALAGLSIGARIAVRRASTADATHGPDATPGPNAAPGIITEMRNRGEFATWRAARASGDHDLNTFFVRVDPVTTDPTLVPGQTVWLTPMRGP
jgi:HlyD family secretion protein